MGINYGKVAEAESSKGGSYFKEGTFKVRVNRCLAKTSSKDGSDMAIIEAEVLESTNDEVPVGSNRSQIISFKFPSAHGNLQGFAQSAVRAMHLQGILEGEPPADGNVEGEVIQAIMEQGIATGVVLNLECVTTTTRAGNPFTKHLWSACNG